MAGPLVSVPLQSQYPKCMGLLYTALAAASINPLETDEADISLLGLAS